MLCVKKKKTICEHVNIRSIFLYIFIYIGFIDSCMLCTIVNKKINFIFEKLIICHGAHSREEQGHTDEDVNSNNSL